MAILNICPPRLKTKGMKFLICGKRLVERESTKVTSCSHIRKWQSGLLKHSVHCVEIHVEFAFWERNREKRLGF